MQNKNRLVLFAIWLGCTSLLLILSYLFRTIQTEAKPSLSQEMEQADIKVAQQIAKKEWQKQNADGSYQTLDQESKLKKQNCTVWKEWIGALPYIENAFDTWGDMDFIGTIASESMWNPNARWDFWASFWYCQLNKNHQKKKIIDFYRNLPNNFEKMAFCHRLYTGWVKQGVIKTRLYWFNRRHEGLKKMQIICK